MNATTAAGDLPAGGAAGGRAPKSVKGLTQAEAALRLVRDGPNALPASTDRGLLRIIFETMREPMFLLLIGAAGLYLVLGSLGEGLFLMGGAIATIGLVVLQESRSERALGALRDLSQPRARVIRDGIERVISARDLVPGDMVLVGEGERLPADGVLSSSDVLSVDESALTGESAPVSKRPLRPGETPDAAAAPGSEAGSSLFSGTLIVRGQAVACITRTGPHTALGRIGASLAAIVSEPTPLQKTAGRLVAWLGLFAIGFCILVAVAYGVLRGDWIGGALAGLTVAIALIPEEFPMVLAVFLALGAGRLAHHRVLVRRSAVIEALGGATVLCVDKTGTLTENRMQVARLWTAAQDLAIAAGASPRGASAELLRLAGLASAARPVDPMDRAIRDLLDRQTSARPSADAAPLRSWPLRPERMAVVQSWAQTDGAPITAAKGAPEAIFQLCHLDADRRDELTCTVETFAGQGLRVLGVAFNNQPSAFPDDPDDADFTFAGLVGFLDPVRKDVPAALAQAQSAGLAVVMITGDHPATALAIARTVGIDVTGGVMLGAELAALEPEGLAEALESVRIFARITPEQKLLLVEGFKAAGEVVAMTGDGVNDAPALETAHIGIAMGRNGTDVARESADLVLMDDSFASIVGGVALGRRIFDNLRRALIYVTAIHVPIAGLAILPIALGLPPLLYPMHVVFLELVIDPVCAMVFEAEPGSKTAMQRPPRPRNEPPFGPVQITMALIQGLGVLAGVMAVYLWALDHYPEPEARGAGFLTLVVGNLTLALVDAASSGGKLISAHRRIYWIIASVAGGVLALVLRVPGLSTIFKVSPPHPELLVPSLLAALFCGSATGLVQRLARSTRPLLQTER